MCVLLYKKIPKSGVHFNFRRKFKIGQIKLGTVGLTDDGYGNLIATFNKQMTKGFLDSLAMASLTKAEGTVTAIFNGDTSNAVHFKKKALTQLVLAKEDANLEYTGAQFINTQKLEVPVPVSVRLTDIDDGYRGDISNASVTFTIVPVTQDASIIGPDSITTSTISFLNKDHTSGIAQAKFKVSTGGNVNAKFKVTAKAGNRYKGSIGVPVVVSTSATLPIAGDGITSSISKQSGVFDVAVMPNPSYTSFNLKVQTLDKLEKLSLRIMDITGRVIESKPAISVGESIQLGEHYMAGTYMVEVKQGQNVRVLKLVKL